MLPTFATRTEALTARATALAVAERRASSLRRLAAQSVAVVATSGFAGGATAAARRHDGASVAVQAVLALVALGLQLRLHAGNRARWAEVAAWTEVEPGTRELGGAVPKRLRAPWDAREDEDFDAVAAGALEAARTRTLSGRLLVRWVLLGIGAGVGLAGLLGGVLSLDGASDDDRAPYTGFAVFGAVLLAFCLAAVVAMLRLGWAASRTWRRLAVEQARWSGLRELAGRRTGGPVAAPNPVAAVALPAVLLGGLLLASALRAGAPGLVLLAVVVVGLAALVVVPRSRRRSEVATARGASAGGAVVDGPHGPGLLEVVDGTWHLGGAALPAVLAATRGLRAVPFAPVTVDLLHEGEGFTTVQVLEPERFDALLDEAGVRRVG